ncbi:MAG: nucleotidyltransferase family protein [Candidatus Altiarchaeota archaeon]|nr:nucleotidyltransferase family protein [Candidatus Altiarchaeota archaeon]
MVGSCRNSNKTGREAEVAEIRRKAVDILKKGGVRRAAFFGSLARREHTTKSDVDILIEFKGRKSLLDLVGLEQELEDSLGRKVDLVTYRSLHPLLKDRILREQEVIL